MLNQNKIMTYEKKKILVYSSSFPNSQNPVSGVFVKDFAKHLSKYYSVTVLAPHLPGSPLFEKENNLKIYRFKQGTFGIPLAGKPGGILPALSKNKLLYLLLPFFLTASFIALCKCIRREKIDIIHAHWVLPQGLLAVLYKLCFNRKIKVIITCHGSDIMKVTGRFSKFLKKLAMNVADLVTAVSEAMQDKIKDLGCKTPCHVIPMGVDVELFKPSVNEPCIRDLLGIKGKIILFAGSLIELKGIRPLLEAMPEVIACGPDINLLFVGDGQLKASLEEKAEQLGISNHVYFAGRIAHDKLPAYFSQSDLFILPSFSEGFGLVVMEALSCELPVVVSDLDVFLKLEDSKRLFTICSPGNVTSISNAINEALSALENGKKELERTFRRNYVETRFSYEIIAKKYSSLIDTLV